MNLSQHSVWHSRTSEYLSLCIIIQLFSGYITFFEVVFAVSSAVLGSLVCCYNVVKTCRSLSPC
jgi:hypothetical protein